MQYSHVAINLGKNYDSETSSFQPSKAGFYWFIFEAFGDQSGRISYAMRDIVTETSTDVQSTKSKSCALSRNDLRTLLPQSRLQMFSLYSYVVWKEDMYGMMWGGFNINDISTNPPIAFCVVRFRKLILATFSPTYKYFDFDVIQVNSGQSWNGRTHIFTAPVDGVYIFSFSASTERKLVFLNMVINYNRTGGLLPNDMSSQNKILMCSSNRDNVIQTVSGSAVVMLNKSDSAFIEREQDGSDMTDDYSQASFRGFLYAPPQNMTVAWSAQLNSYDPDKINNALALSFDDIVFDIGNVFARHDKSKITVPIGGVYYVTFKASLTLYNTAIVALFVDEKHLIEVRNEDDIRSYPTTYERSILVQLAVSNKLSIRLISGTSPLALTFTGFLVAPS